MIIKTPPYLQPGDTIGIVCPAGYMALEKAAECIRVLQELWGYKVKLGRTVGGNSATYFSGTDDDRLKEFQEMLDDGDINAVLCARGGYGMGRIIDKINFRKFKRAPKWVIGFSDITIFHTHLNSNFSISSLHGPMAAAFNDSGYNSKYVLSLKDALEGKKAKYKCSTYELNRPGKSVGQLVGGNLTLLANGLGTRSEIKTRDRILFIEDIGEQKYSIDRMLHQLKRSGKLDKLAGLIVGRFSDTTDTDRPFGAGVQQIVYDIVSEFNYPVCFEFPVSHEPENYALKIGAKYKLTVAPDKVLLEE